MSSRQRDSKCSPLDTPLATLSNGCSLTERLDFPQAETAGLSGTSPKTLTQKRGGGNLLSGRRTCSRSALHLCICQGATPSHGLVVGQITSLNTTSRGSDVPPVTTKGKDKNSRFRLNLPKRVERPPHGLLPRCSPRWASERQRSSYVTCGVSWRDSSKLR